MGNEFVYFAYIYCSIFVALEDINFFTPCNRMFDSMLTGFTAAVQKRIIARVKKDGVFTIQLDSTTDVAVWDQMCLVVRSVLKFYLAPSHTNTQAQPQTEMTEERLLDVCKVQRGRAAYLFDCAAGKLNASTLN